jgi:4-amino-4-deoxy-L-arabinose transferase-like glycosyltransferase
MFFLLGGIIILAILFVLQSQYLTSSLVNIIGVPLDDVYIHCRYAENLLNGSGYCFNPDTMVTADTSPMWVVLIAFGGLFTSHLDIVAVLLSALAWLAIAPGVYRFAKYVCGFEEVWAIGAAILALLSSRLLAASLSGMETTLAALLTLIAIEVHIRSRDAGKIRLREALVLGLAIATRPELYILLMLCAADWMLLAMKKKIALRGLIGYFFVIALFVGAVLSLPYLERGSFVYHSSKVQGAGLRLIPDFFYIAKTYFILLENYGWFFLVMIITITKLRLPKFDLRFAVPILFVILLPIVQGFIAPQYRHFGRYIFPLLPLVALGVMAFVRKNIVFEKNRYLHKSTTIIAALFVIVMLPLSVRWTMQYSDCVSNIMDQQVTSAEWVLSYADKNDVIAADDVGALGYFTKRNIIDLTGLVSPEMYPLQHDQQLVWKAARDKGANIFIIYRRWNPSLFAFAKDSLELVKDLRVSRPLSSSADTVLSIYRLKGAVYAAP